MAGHSKWANIKHKKAAADAKRGKIWTRLIKEITVAAKLGGGDPDSNPRLRLSMDRAMDANMPKDNIQRAIQRGVGGLEGGELRGNPLRGYGLSGAAIIVDCLTDNRTRTVAEVRHAFPSMAATWAPRARWRSCSPTAASSCSRGHAGRQADGRRAGSGRRRRGHQ